MVFRSPTPLLLCALILSEVSPLSAQQLIQIPADHFAQARQVVRPVAVRHFTDKATTTIQYDDGEIDTAYGGTPSVNSLDLAMRFDLPESGLRLNGVEICLARGGTDDSLNFVIPIWSAGGPGGTPGALIDVIPAQANGIGPNGSFYSFDLSAQNVVIPGSTAFLGIGFSPSMEQEIFVCADQDGSSVQPGFFRLDQGAWSSLLNLDPEYTALILRGTFASGDPIPTTCVPSATRLCLNDDRFQVEVDWRTPSGATGEGQAVRLTDDTGYFWFFNPNNVEMVLKVLNGCPVNDRYWVFAGGLTNVEVTMTVTDTETGTVAPPYRNPLRTPFQPIQDTQAFATCP